MSEENQLAVQKGLKVNSAAIQTIMGRSAQEIQGAVFMAKQFPRDQLAAHDRIMDACHRPSLAKVARYSYPRGKETIAGPSIRLAEVLAQNWGNMSAGIVELEQRNGESTALAFAWDLETNTRIERIFTVPHIREKKGGNERLTDPRDIYEIVTNMGARRMRACILAVIPRDVQDDAVAECRKTMAGKTEGPLIDRLKKMIDAFKPFSVTKEMIETKVGYVMDAFTEEDFLDMMDVFNSLKDGIAKREDFFTVPGGRMAAPEGGSHTAEEVEAEFRRIQEEKAKAGSHPDQATLG